jgi:hypothetical protein
MLIIFGTGVMTKVRTEQQLYLAKWKKENPEKVRQQRQRYYLKYREKLAVVQKNYRKKNPRIGKNSTKKYKEKNRKKLGDWYLKEKLVQRGFAPHLITPEIIAMERARILLKREIKKQVKENVPENI